MLRRNKDLDTKQIPFFAGEIRKGVSLQFHKDLYFILMQGTWLQLIVFIILAYLISNLFFASLYVQWPYAISEQRVVSFWDAFFFSIQTMSTIGYGLLHPSSLTSNIIVSIESAYGMIATAGITGVVFAKLSKPNAKILFSRNILDTVVNGHRVLCFRMGNIRGNDIVDARLNLSALIEEKTTEGQEIARIYDLKLQRDRSPFFRLSWTI